MDEKEYEVTGAVTITVVHKAAVRAGSEAEAIALFDAALLKGEYDDELQQAFDPRKHEGMTTDWTEVAG